MSFYTLIFYQVSYNGNNFFSFPGMEKRTFCFHFSGTITNFFIKKFSKLSGNFSAGSFLLISGLWLLSGSSLSGQCDIFTGSASITTAINCNGENATVTLTTSGGYTPYTVTFGAFPPVTSNNTSWSFVTPSGTGYPWSIASDGCTTLSGSLDVIEPPSINASVVVLTATCFNQATGTAVISAEGGAPPYLFSGDGINYDTSSLMTGLATGDHTFYIMDINGCIITVTAEITSLLPLSPGAHNTVPITVCPNYNPDVLIFTTPVTGGVAPYSYQWYSNGTPAAGATNSVYDPLNLLNSGTYSFYCTVSDGCGQVENTSAKIITVVEEATIAASGGGTFCQNDFVTLTSETTGGTGTILYQWQESPDNITWTSISGATSNAFNPPTGVAGQNRYRVDLTVNGAACNDPLSNSLTVTVNPLPVTSAIYHQ